MFIEDRSGAAMAEALDAFVIGSPTSLIYATSGFMGLVADHLGAQARCLFCLEGERVVAVLPYLVKEGHLGKVYNSLAYYGSNGGVIQVERNDEVAGALVEFFYQLAEREGAVCATLISNPLEPFAVYERHSKYDCRDERIGQITHLPALANIDELMSRFSDPRPRNIRKAIKEGVTIREGRSQADVDFLFTTHVENITAIGGLSKQRSFFDAIPAFVDAQNWKIFVAEKDGQPVAALLLFYHNRTVEYFTPVIVESARSTQALALIVYTAMQDAIANGFANWNWGGTWLSQGGVYDFKKKWGTTDYPYYYYTRIFDVSLKTRSRQELLGGYQGFFLLPFSELRA